MLGWINYEHDYNNQIRRLKVSYYSDEQIKDSQLKYDEGLCQCGVTLPKTHQEIGLCPKCFNKITKIDD